MGETVRVRVLYPFSHENVVLREGEELIVVEKKNADWWQVMRPKEISPDMTPFYAPTGYLELLSNKPRLKPEIKSRTRLPLSVSNTDTASTPSPGPKLGLGIPESKSDDNLLSKVTSPGFSRQRSTSMDGLTFRDHLSNLSTTKLAIDSPDKHKKTRLAKDIWDRRKSWAIEPCITTIPPPPEFAKEDWTSAPNMQRFSYSEPMSSSTHNLPALSDTEGLLSSSPGNTLGSTGSSSPKTLPNKSVPMLPPRPPPRNQSSLRSGLFLPELDKVNLPSTDKAVVADKAPALPPKGRMSAVLNQSETLVPVPVSPTKNSSSTTPFFTPESSPGSSGPTPPCTTGTNPSGNHYSKVVPLPRGDKPRLAPRVKHLSESLERLSQQIHKSAPSMSGTVTGGGSIVLPPAPDLPPKPNKTRYENVVTAPQDAPAEETVVVVPVVAKNLGFNNPLFAAVDRSQELDDNANVALSTPSDAVYRNADFFKESLSLSSDDNLGSKDSLDSILSSSDKSFSLLDDEQTKPKVSPVNKPEPPPSPMPGHAPRRFLPDGWLEYSLPSGRPYYYHPPTGSKSWKPPRRNTPIFSNSISDLKEKLGMTDRDGRIRAFSTDEEATPGELPTFSSFHFSVKGRGFRSPQLGQKHFREVAEERKKKSNSKSKSKNLLPTGWIKSWDVEAEEVCYINSVTKAKWYSSLDDEGRVYFFEENSNESVWTLPEIACADAQATADVTTPTFTYPVVEQNLLLLTPPSVEVVPTVAAPSEETWPTSSPAGTATQRHSGSSRSDRNLKARSMVVTPVSVDDTESVNAKASKLTLPLNVMPPSSWTTGSLPRSVSTISGQWPSLQAGAFVSDWIATLGLNVIHQGVLHKTKITDQGRKVRKNWSSSFVVLTDLFLLLVKDAKAATQVRSGNVANMPELCVDLKGAILEWAGDRSSRKNVFQISTVLGLQMLLQDDDATVAKQWFEAISQVIQQLPSSQVTGAVPVPISPTKVSNIAQLMTPPTPESPRRFGRLVRTKSTKVRILGSTEDLTAAVPPDRQNKLRDKLKKFFVRRPNIDTLMKKGIYKDEPVFGCRLQNLCAVEQTTVPRFVKYVIGVIESHPENMKADGLYRASGNLSQVQKIRLQVDQDRFGVLDEEEDVHVLTGALKLFFRELKEPLICHGLFSKALQATSVTKPTERAAKLKDIVNMLPKENYDTLKFLLGHLLKVTEYREHNRMHISNLSIVFGPTLMWPLADSVNLALDMMQQNLVVEALLTQYADIFTKSKS